MRCYTLRSYCMKIRARQSVVMAISIMLSLCAYAQQTVGLFHNNEAKSYNGLTLFSAMGSNMTYLIDNCGRKVHSWPATARAAFSVYLLDDGSILRPEADQSNMNFNLGMSGGRIERIAWDGTIVWSTQLGNDKECPHHDICPLPNGNILVIMWEVKTREEVIAAGRPAPNAGECWSEKIVEIKPIGTTQAEIVWEWHLWDHLIQFTDSTKPNYGRPKLNPHRFDVNAVVPPVTFADWVHLNSIAYDAERDEIVLSARSPSEIWVIDHSTTTAEAASSRGGRWNKGGDFLYRWGNKSMYRQGTPEEATLGHQHNAQFVRDDENRLGFLVFNNDAGTTGAQYSTVDIIYPPMNEDKSYALNQNVFGPDSASRRFVASPRESMYSAIISGAQLLPNGNLLFCEGTKGNFIEADANNEIVWKYVNPDVQGNVVEQGADAKNNSVFRCTRYPYNHPAFSQRILSPQGAVERNSLPDECTLSSFVNDNAENLSVVSFRNGTEMLRPQLDFRLNQSCTARFRIFSIDGRCVADFNNGLMQAGEYSLNLQTLISHGLYFFHVDTEYGSITKKLLFSNNEK